MGFSIGRLFVKSAPTPTSAPAPQEATAAAAAPLAASSPEDVLSVSKNVRQVTVKPNSALSITAKKGDTYWGLASRYAATKSANGVPTSAEIGAYVKDLEKLNGKTLKAGLEIKLPLNQRSTYKMSALIAAQQDMQARAKAGEKLPKFDWASADAQWGYAESMDVTVHPAEGGKPEVLAVREYGSAKGGGTIFSVATKEKAEPVTPPASIMRRVTVPSNGSLAVTVKQGDTLTSLARRFAASQKAPEPPSSAEIKAYVKDLEKLNGKTLKAGQAVRLPLTPNAGFMLPALIAAQQDWIKRGKQAAPKLDWGAATARWDYAESIAVTVPGLSGSKGEALSVREYGPAKGGTEFEVAFRDEFYRQSGLE